MSILTLLANTIQLDRPIPETPTRLLPNILAVVFGILGGISVIVIIWAGTKYSLSGGDPTKTAEAKNQIMYAAIGIIVALSAEAIVKFVIGRLG
jgi:hypothetical protein